MNTMGSEVATLAGGCFWCLEAVFQQLGGIGGAVSGYTGGTVKNPSYQQVCNGSTGHAEAVQITFDPEIISYREVLEIFFAFHDPTTLNRQGPDSGTQYRSAVFFHSPEQKRIAEKVIADLSAERIWKNPIVTEVVPGSTFFPAEGYHQEYYERNREAPYCQVMIEPKLEKLRAVYAARLKRPADLGASP